MARTYGVVVGSYLAFLLAVLGALAWATGAAILLPSLGPSAYVLAAIDHQPRRVVVGQLLGALLAFAAVLTIAAGATPLLDATAQSTAAGRRVAAAVVSTAAVTVGMHLTNSIHPPAYATVLIVLLGIADGPEDVVAFAAGVFVLVGVHTAVERHGPWEPPY
jgi:hypothetical protein